MTLAAVATPSVDWYALAPLLVLLGGSCLCVLAAVLLPEGWRLPAGAAVALGSFVGAGITAAFLFADSERPQSIVAGAAVQDRLGSLTAVILCGAGLVAAAIAWRHGFRRHGAEYYGLLLAAAAGMVFLVQATNLMTLFLGLEWFSLTLYVLCAYDVGVKGSLEAGLKYLVVGSFGSAVLLFGSAFVYGATGELGFAEIASATASQGLEGDLFLVAGLAMVVVGLGFKVSAAPFHMWTPDVYEGAPTPVTAFMSAATKAAALVLTLRLLTTAFPDEAELWTIAVAAIVCVSLAVGNLAALVQTSVKRLLAYSSVAQAGFLLIPVAAGNETGGTALLFYLIPYGAASLGAFAVVGARERELGRPATLETMGGMGWERPLLGAAMWVFMLSFAGLPLTGGFVAKFYAFTAAWERDWTWLVVVGVIATAVSLYYYLAVIRSLYMRPAAAAALPAGGQPPRELMLSAGVVACVAVVVGSFFAVEPLIDLAEKAAASLSFPY
ncbi:MAG TPA: NADH-quinone oxidoreductase subunit N [Gaiellaceae bacterium]|nr:NADH-quinone oxidoreductase subunit N [Gaiellaceae bacterium]